MSINGSTGTPVVLLGTQETIAVTGTGQCWADVWTYDHGQGQWVSSTELGVFTHYYDFGDGNSFSAQVNGTDPDRTQVYTHGYAGFYHVKDDIACSCADGTSFYVDALPTVAQDVIVVAQAGPPSGIVVRLTFDDGPAVGGNNNTQHVYNALQTNPVQSNIRATFFVQTHVTNPERGGTANGAALMLQALSRGHNVMIHTGWTVSHVLHTDRVAAQAYAGGANGLESDLILAKARIQSLPGPVPTYVRPPEGFRNAAVLQTYAAQGLEMKLWDVQSGDDVSPHTFASISAQLETQLRDSIMGGDRDIIVLFHDIHDYTADNLVRSTPPAGYIQQIKDVAASLGYNVAFEKL